ncbi:MAG TPA: PAS domain-containing protein [Hyphomicrobiaceae bacterium]|nr:PAS domain-containing protein [Hyphomicrobiaceae bacterium]
MDFSEIAVRLFTDTPDGVLFSDTEGKISAWNRGCERIFGFSTEDALGQSLDIIIPEPLRARHWTGFHETMRTGVTKYADGELLSVPAMRKDGRRISVEFSILPFRDSDGAMIGMAAIMRDVTARFEELKALRKQMAANEAGQKAQRA